MPERCQRHPGACPFRAETQRAFDVFVEANRRLYHGEVGTQQVRDARAAYDEARAQMQLHCEGLEVPA